MKYHDDFEWQQQYPAAHYAQTQQLEQEFLFELPRGSEIKDNKVVIPSNYSKDIHVNHRLILETIAQHDINNVFEVGFGYANNLYNIHLLFPDIMIYGCDISTQQYYMALQRYNECNNFYLTVEDFLLMNIPENCFDFVFSQAVIMHMSTNKSIMALQKMVNISKRFVLSTDGGLQIPNIRKFIASLGKVTFYDDIAEKYWTDYNIPPFLIEKE